MDTSKKYIKMCKEAKEIQEEWEPMSGDLIAHTHYGINNIGIHVYDGYGHSYNVYTGGGETEYYDSPRELKNSLWLPRQDQLQEMIVDWDIPAKLFVFGIPAAGYEVYDPMQATLEGLYYLHSDFNSWEQLWLAFVMKEKYNKIWDDNKKNG